MPCDVNKAISLNKTYVNTKTTVSRPFSKTCFSYKFSITFKVW